MTALSCSRLSCFTGHVLCTECRGHRVWMWPPCFREASWLAEANVYLKLKPFLGLWALRKLFCTLRFVRCNICTMLRRLEHLRRFTLNTNVHVYFLRSIIFWEGTQLVFMSVRARKPFSILGSVVHDSFICGAISSDTPTNIGAVYYPNLKIQLFWNVQS